MAAGTSAVVSKTATGTSTIIPVDKHSTGNIPVGLVLDFTTVTAVGTASAEYTFDDPADSAATWFALASLSGKTATTADVTTMPARAWRLNVSAYTSGTISLRISQGCK